MGHTVPEIGTAAVQAARDAGVKHLIWSTLPDSEKLTGGRIKVAHFALAAGDQLPDDSYLGVCGGVYSFNDLSAH